ALGGRRAEGLEGAGAHRASGASGRVPRFEIAAHQFEFTAGNVVEFGMAFEPAKLEVVLADHAGVGGRALAEVDLAVGPDGGAVRMVVTEAGQAVDQRRDQAFGRNAQDAAALECSAFGNVEVSIGVGHACPGAVLSAARDLAGAAV